MVFKGSKLWFGFFVVFVFVLQGFANSVWAWINPIPSAFWVTRSRMEIFLPRSVTFGLRWDQPFEVKLIIDGQSGILLPILHHVDNHIVVSTSSFSDVFLKSHMSSAFHVEIWQNQRLGYRSSVVLTGILDDFFYHELPLGVFRSGGDIWVRLWAPTARQVELLLFKTPNSVTPDDRVKMEKRSEWGVWQHKVSENWYGRYYRFQIEVFHPGLNQTVTWQVTDPYSQSLSTNSSHSWLGLAEEVNPADWNHVPSPRQILIQRPFGNKGLANRVIYETHIRHLTAYDPKIPSELRGKYLGLTLNEGLAINHLKRLQKAGVTTLQLMPLQDFATVPEIAPKEVKIPDTYSWDSISNLLEKVRSEDNYNWGYDPVHYFAPEGSYAVSPHGANRIMELKQMLLKLYRLNFEVSLDVVFNHTYASYDHEFSVLDKIVPGYYYRWRPTDGVANSSCCSDTASERKMFERLMIDAALFWARVYKITAFRFDLMNLHSRSTMEKIRDHLKRLYPQSYIYGEAWPFGSLYDRYPDQAMTQWNSYGAGIGTFNDRMRDALRGGTTQYREWTDQGVVSGLIDHFNHSFDNQNTPVTEQGRVEKFLHYLDVVKIGLTGNLRHWRFYDHLGNWVEAGHIFFRGQPVAVAHSTVETINYVSVHDGFTLWDVWAAKLPFESPFYHHQTASLDELVRRHQLALSFVLLSQGIPFIEGGSELLHSKNGDVDSYDSGDFYNSYRWGDSGHTWGLALPPRWKNGDFWPFWMPRLVRAPWKAQLEHIQETIAVVERLIKIRRQWNHFHLVDLTAIQNRVRFFKVTEHPLGLLPMVISGNPSIMVIWNVTRNPLRWEHPELNKNWKSVWSHSLGVTRSEIPLKGAMEIPSLSVVFLYEGKK
ncbi:MAG: DUF3372 domain-containing protein [Bdellovibrionaceae bacterium]|nr:DUF3372 domain-containing protein [Pseudobdellovibrionaceae bacterium]MDW8190219.1 DUF3372 domain-containing protein [Pseudobdellovibrionaceae bacterium]